jgi:hypothetical protein
MSYSLHVNSTPNLSNECSGMSNVQGQHRGAILIELKNVYHEIRNRYGVIRIGLFG